MSPLERIQVQRAEEQMASVRMDEPTKWDRWSIKPAEVQGRRDRAWRREHCLACGAKAARGSSYCSVHYYRVVRDGEPWDLDAYVITRAERDRVRAIVRSGFRAGASSHGEGPEHISKPIARVLSGLKSKVEG